MARCLGCKLLRPTVPVPPEEGTDGYLLSPAKRSVVSRLSSAILKPDAFRLGALRVIRHASCRPTQVLASASACLPENVMAVR